MHRPLWLLSGMKNVTLETELELFTLEFELGSMNNYITKLNLKSIVWDFIYSFELNCNKLETESIILKLNLFALKVSFIIPEHSALCILANSVLTIQFKVLQPNFSLVRQTPGL